MANRFQLLVSAADPIQCGIALVGEVLETIVFPKAQTHMKIPLPHAMRPLLDLEDRQCDPSGSTEGEQPAQEQPRQRGGQDGGEQHRNQPLAVEGIEGGIAIHHVDRGASEFPIVEVEDRQACSERGEDHQKSIAQDLRPLAARIEDEIADGFAMDGLISGLAVWHADLLRKGFAGSIRYSRTRNHRPSLALVGAGRMGRHHARAIARGTAFRLVAVVDPTEPDWADVHWERDLELALHRLRPEAAIVAVPSQQHERVARLCLEAGCHVLVEKPICPSIEAALRLEREFLAAGKVLFGGHSERFHPVFTALSERVEPGSVERALAIRTGPQPERAFPDDVLLDLAIHDVDLALRLVGPLTLKQPAAIIGGLETVVFRSSRGSKVELRCGYQAGRIRTWEVVTDRERFEADFLGRTLRRVTSGSTEEVRIGEGDPLEREHHAFRRAMEGRDSALDLALQIESIGLLERART